MDWNSDNFLIFWCTLLPTLDWVLHQEPYDGSDAQESVDRGEMMREREMEAEQDVESGVSILRYIGISILIKYSNFSGFYEKLGPFYKKTQM